MGSESVISTDETVVDGKFVGSDRQVFLSTANPRRFELEQLVDTDSDEKGDEGGLFGSRKSNTSRPSRRNLRKSFRSLNSLAKNSLNKSYSSCIVPMSRSVP